MENEKIEPSNNKNFKIIMVFVILALLAFVIGGTFAYWSWQTSANQQTNIAFTVTSGFTCSANGGGNITSSDVELAPSPCTNSTYAIKRTVTVNPTISQNGIDVYMDLWLKVNSIGSGLAASENFKYAFTRSSSSCATDVVIQGNFNGAAANTQKPLLQNKVYSATTSDTYYLWIWLDEAETSSSTYDQTFDMELGGNCTDGISTAYTVNLYDSNAAGFNSVWQGQPISNNITIYDTPGDAITALETVYSNANNGTTRSLPFFLKHEIGDGTFWCADEYDNGVANGISVCVFPNQAVCNSTVPAFEHDNITYSCRQNDFTRGVTESYVGFVIKPAMVTANPGMVAGTYYLRGGDLGVSFLANAKIIYDAFGGINCYSDYTQITGAYDANYNPSPSSYFECHVAGLGVSTSSAGGVEVEDSAASICIVDYTGVSNCRIL